MLAGKIMGLVESGFTPDEIMNQLKDQSDTWKNGTDKEKEKFSNEIMLISQPLAYRDATLEDAPFLERLLNNAYNAESLGPEAFREGNVTNLTSIEDLISSNEYKWIIMEAPDGLRGDEQDGFLLGASCYSTSGTSRRNGKY